MQWYSDKGRLLDCLNCSLFTSSFLIINYRSQFPKNITNNNKKKIEWSEKNLLKFGNSPELFVWEIREYWVT